MTPQGLCALASLPLKYLSDGQLRFCEFCLF